MCHNIVWSGYHLIVVSSNEMILKTHKKVFIMFGFCLIYVTQCHFLIWWPLWTSGQVVSQGTTLESTKDNKQLSFQDCPAWITKIYATCDLHMFSCLRFEPKKNFYPKRKTLCQFVTWVTTWLKDFVELVPWLDTKKSWITSTSRHGQN